MIPRIEFVYSWIYDELRRNDPIIAKKLKKINKEYPSPKKIKKYIEKIEKIWRNDEKIILKLISKITGLKWREKVIKCYVVGKGKCFSDPLTIRIFKNQLNFIDVLTHELIHQIQSQNANKWKKWRRHVDKKYKKEPEATKRHIFLHAVHWKLLLSLYNKKRLNKNIIFHKDTKDYKRAWEIVQKEGYQKIISKFTKITK